LPKSRKFKIGPTPTLKLIPLNTKPSKKNLKLSSTQSCKKSIKPLEGNPEDNLASQEDKDSQEDSQDKDPNKEVLQDQLSMKSIDL
jgi:hypothetical protein